LDSPKRLLLKWRTEFRPELKAEGYARCVIELEPESDAVKLTIHPHNGPRGVKVHLGHVQWLAAYSLQPEIPARNRPEKRVNPKAVYVLLYGACSHRVFVSHFLGQPIGPSDEVFIKQTVATMVHGLRPE
jgi:hypothetical protein